MRKGQIVTVKTACVPAGLVPDYYARLIYPYESEGKIKWYAEKTPTHPGPLHTVVDSHKIYILYPEVKVKDND